MLRFIDVGGHEKYLKTALYGMTSLLPDYMLLCVSARATEGALPRAAREHLAVALALEIPLAVVLTQVRHLVSFSCFLLSTFQRQLFKRTCTWLARFLSSSSAHA